MRRRASRSWLKAVAPLIVAGTFTLAANVAAGIEPGQPSPIPDWAFRPVTVPESSPGSLAAPVRAPDLNEIRDPFLPAAGTTVQADDQAEGQAERAQPQIRPARPIVVSVAPKTTHTISGNASWYCRAGVSICTNDHPDGGDFDAYAAAGPKLRAAIGDGWRGKIVYVDGIRVKLIDWCQCYKGEPHEKLLDLYYDVYSRTGTNVTIRW